MNHILVLCTKDHVVEGHAFSIYMDLKTKGHDVYFLPLISEHTNSCPNSFCDAHHGKWRNFPYFMFKVGHKLSRLGKGVIPDTEEHCFYNYSAYFKGDAKSILKRSIPNPNTIIIGWSDFFISPKVVYDLYHLTKARIILLMPDAHIIGGGCHYPCGCLQYETGCKNCPAVTDKRVPAKLYEEKMRFLKGIPLTIIGTKYELTRASKVPFLMGKDMISTIPIPQVPFTISKSEARKKFGISDADFVIMAGAFSFQDKRKGFKYLKKALALFGPSINDGRPVTLILPGNDVSTCFNAGKNYREVTPGYLKIEDLFAAYYASDVFISTSMDDSGPYTVSYSIACGIPVISFPIGIAIDIVRHQSTGYIAKYLDSRSVAEGLIYYYNLSKDDWEIQSERCKELMNALKTQHVAWQDKLQF